MEIYTLRSELPSGSELARVSFSFLHLTRLRLRLQLRRLHRRLPMRRRRTAELSARSPAAIKPLITMVTQPPRC